MTFVPYYDRNITCSYQIVLTISLRDDQLSFSYPRQGLALTFNLLIFTTISYVIIIVYKKQSNPASPLRRPICHPTDNYICYDIAYRSGGHRMAVRPEVAS